MISLAFGLGVNMGGGGQDQSQSRIVAQNAANLALLTPYAQSKPALSDAVTVSGDSLARGYNSSAPNQPSTIAGGYFTATVNNIAADGTRADAIRATFAALAAGQQNDYGITDGGTNDVVQGPYGLSGVPSVTITAAGSGGTNGTFALAFSGGAGTGPTTPVGTFTVAGGIVTAVTITNPGGGYSTPPTISTAASAGLTGATLTPVTDVALTIVQNISAVAAFSANRLLMGPWTATPMSIQARRACESLKTTYGGRFLDNLRLLIRYQNNGSDLTSVIKGLIPPSLSIDNLHPNDTGYVYQGQEWARMILASSGVGAPYIHDECVSCVVTNGATAWTPRVLGTPTSYAFTVGNEAGDFSINSGTGVIAKSATGVMAEVTELYVQAQSANGASNVARVVVGRKEVSTTPTHGVRVNGGGYIGGDHLTGGTSAKKVTLVICARVNDSVSGNYVLRTARSSGRSFALQKNGNQFRFLNTNDALSLTLIGPSAPVAADMTAYNFYFFNIDSTTGVQTTKAVTNEAFGGVQSGTPVADELYSFDELVYLFDGITNLDIKMLWIAQDWIDVTDPIKRALFYNPATLAPIDLGAAGTVNGITPLIYFQGYAGDYMTGNNRGTGGTFYAPPYVNAKNQAFIGQTN